MKFLLILLPGPLYSANAFKQLLLEQFAMYFKTGRELIPFMVVIDRDVLRNFSEQRVDMAGVV